ncbi:FAD binding domain-containing protein [Nocardioides iriomotensis]|uniref:Xanthine dehydrogenase family protein subunit M n=1 Tax=Nocardioides iriomotensis TaxID=715784 RepID=A0A4V1Z1K0_9ACTN|nr:FAD binding domain-containing protein [Nocardioides iriomotensis]RYU11176.1 xanthine dehydrogenase family protein subunit M [Nocardioides iriomotensis]
MKPPAFTYHRPATVQEAVQLLDAHAGEGAKVLAGGQSLVPLMSMRLAAPGHLVDINHVAGLDTVEVTSTGVRVGALARHSRVEHDAAAFAALPLLRQALGQVAHPTIRNRGTTVGSLVHGDPAAEMTAVLAVLDGEVELVGPHGSRSVGAADFFVGPMETEHADAEVAVAATFRRPPAGTGSAFVELARRHGDYAMCGVAALVTVDADLAVTGARVGLISVGAGPVVVDLGPAVSGSGGGVDTPRARELVDAAIDPEDDIHATATYRRHLAHVLTERAVAQAHEAARGTRRSAA